MSGPITPPLTVTEIDGSPSGRPITTIKVSNGDLTVSGNTATIDTSGSGTVTSITLAADSGTGSALTTSGTFTFTGGTGVTTSVTGTTVTIVADNNGDVTATGSPADNELAVWASASSIEGTAGRLTWDGSVLTVTGDVAIDGELKVNTITSEDTDADIVINPNGTGEVKISNAYFLPTAAPGDNNYVLTGQADGTSAWAAAAGGTQYSIVPPDVQSGLNATYGKFAPIQRYSIYTTTVSGGGLEERLRFFPFTAPIDGTMAAITLRSTGTTTGKDTCNVAIYSPDSDGLPATRMGYLELDMNGGAGLYSSSSWDSAPVLVGGNTYYYATGSSGATFMTTIATRSYLDQLSILGFTHYPGTGYTGFGYDTDHTVPATIDPATELIGVQEPIPVFYFLYT